MPLFAAAATFFLPGLLVLGAALSFLQAEKPGVALLLAIAFPLGLVPGYHLVGAPGRGAWVAVGAYGLVIAGVMLLVLTPTQFEDAGALVAGVIGAIGLGLAVYAGWAAWDVYRLATPRS